MEHLENAKDLLDDLIEQLDQIESQWQLQERLDELLPDQNFLCLSLHEKNRIEKVVEKMSRKSWRASSLPPEVEEGNSEYKLHLCAVTSDTAPKRVTQLQWRLDEGNGRCSYFIGYSDDGKPL